MESVNITTTATITTTTSFSLLFSLTVRIERESIVVDYKVLLLISKRLTSFIFILIKSRCSCNDSRCLGRSLGVRLSLDEGIHGGRELLLLSCAGWFKGHLKTTTFVRDLHIVSVWNSHDEMLVLLI